MANYLGEFPFDITGTMYESFTPSDWAMTWIEHYGQIDGAHHKAWVLDQVARILQGTEIDVKEARWGDGHTEIRISLKEPSKQYCDWVDDMKFYEGEEYDYDKGIAP
ncbi:hypothetical protein phiOC_p143 [Ochrobactrum phage vB_OspM_OC]|nr:hypothetical protein phiOC_p143 [Ochrobactrum phage vB_OspM_OC]